MAREAPNATGSSLIVTPRSGSYRGASFTTQSDILANPELLIEHIEALKTQAEAEAVDPLGRIITAMERLRPPWHRDPSRGCAGMSPTTFVSKSPKVRAEAFEACGRCPADIRKACARWAIEVGDTEAIAGGMDGAARRPLIAEYRKMSTEGDGDG